MGLIGKGMSWMTGGLPIRQAGFLQFNCGAMFYAIMALFKPFLSKKMRDRMMIFKSVEDMNEHIYLEKLPKDLRPSNTTDDSDMRNWVHEYFDKILPEINAKTND